MAKKLPGLRRHPAPTASTEDGAAPPPAAAESPLPPAATEGAAAPKSPLPPLPRRRAPKVDAEGAVEAKTPLPPLPRRRAPKAPEPSAEPSAEASPPPPPRRRAVKPAEPAPAPEPPAAEPEPPTAEPEPPPAEPATALEPVPDRAADARALVDRYVRFAGVGGAVPVPLLDIAAVAAVQTRMLVALARHYDTPLARHRAQAIVMALMGSVTPHALASTAGGLVARALPLVGLLTGIATGALAAGATTRIMGRLFVDHFELDGATLDVATLRARLHETRATA